MEAVLWLLSQNLVGSKQISASGRVSAICLSLYEQVASYNFKEMVI